MKQAVQEIERANDLLQGVLDIVDGAGKGQLGEMKAEDIKKLQEVYMSLEECSNTLTQITGGTEE